MKIPLRSAFAALRCDRPKLLAIALIGALAFTAATVRADDNAVATNSSPTIAPADNAAELTKKLQNPIASLVSVPIQNNFDFGAGPKNDGFQYLVRIQPVIPVSLNENWNLISRTILPVISQEDYIGTSSQSGLGDVLQSFFFSPTDDFHGWIWGAGPVFQLPTATENLLGSEQWCAGPTAVVLKQEHGWTYGALVNQVWSFEGWGSQAVNYTYLQPFVSYTTKTHTTFALNTESSYNWQNGQWTVPINLTVKQLVMIGKVPIQFEFGPRYYAQTPNNGPDWGLRFSITFLFPR